MFYIFPLALKFKSIRKCIHILISISKFLLKVTRFDNAIKMHYLCSSIFTGYDLGHIASDNNLIHLNNTKSNPLLYEILSQKFFC